MSPQGELIDVRGSDLSDNANDLAEAFSFDYQGNPNGTWHLIVADDHPLDGGMLTSWTLAESAGKKAFRDAKPMTIPQPTEDRADIATIGIRGKKPSKSSLRLGRVALTGDTQFTRLEVDVAKKLSALPKRLSVTFVIDASYTMESRGLDAQFKLIEAYLSHVPNSEFSLVAYGRHAEVLTPTFVKAKNLAKVRARLEAAGKLRLRNGSFLDRGIAAAAPALAPRKGNQALVLLTDDRLRPAWRTEAALAEIAKLPADTIVHVADVAPWGDVDIERDDSNRLFPLAKARGGVFVTASGLEESKASELRPEVLYLVRPNRIDHVSVEGLGEESEKLLSSDTGADGDNLTVLREGEGRRWMAQVRNAPRQVTLGGQLWSRPIVFDAKADREPFNKATAGFVFSQDHDEDLSDAEKFVVASYGNVVSPVTSFLAIEPGVRPSVIGLGVEGLGGIGSGLGSRGVLGQKRRPRIDWINIVDRVQRACAAHGKAEFSVNLSLQSREIADITLDSKSTNTAAETCAVEALWKTTLPQGSGTESWTKQLTVRIL